MAWLPWGTDPVSTTTPGPVEAQCHGKQGFSDHALAVKVARKGARSKDRAVSAYKCPHCHMYHVGQSVMKRTQAGVGRGIKILEKHA